MKKSVYRAKQCTIKKKKFSQGRSNIVDENQCGRSFLIATRSTEQQGREFIRADRRVTANNIAMAIGRSHGLAYSLSINNNTNPTNQIKRCPKYQIVKAINDYKGRPKESDIAVITLQFEEKYNYACLKRGRRELRMHAVSSDSTRCVGNSVEAG
ncbi:hypothetical protein TNCV_1695671 [Trichonephila clavipes]|nr:hypothetical protein TNCV_1695671 [Trichonephila clavipes]